MVTLLRADDPAWERREVELILLVKHLLYTEKFTIEGARRKLDEHRKGEGVRPAARAGLEMETVQALERDLREILAVLEGGAL